jgi:hypothetical protein
LKVFKYLGITTINKNEVKDDSSITIDNIFVDITRLSSSATCPIINGPSDHDAQFLHLITLFQQLT